MKQLTYIALAATLVCGIGVALAETTPPSLNAPAIAAHSSLLNEISIPSDIGYTLEVRPVSPASTSQTNRIVIHIQEAHTNYEGQKHLAAMLEQLIVRYGIKLVLVEGGHGDANLDYLRAYGSVKQRKEAAEENLRLGLITGEEYLDITSDHPLQLWGIEDRGLYQTNVRLFMEVNTLQPQLRKALGSVRQAIELLRPRVFSKSLLDAEALTQGFNQQKIGLSQYSGRLIEQAQSSQVALDLFSSVRAMGLVEALNSKCKREELPKEQALLMAQLSKRIDQVRFDQLIGLAKQMKAGTIAREVFYKELDSTITQAQADMQPYPNLAVYMQSLKTLDAIDPAVLSRQLDELALQLRRALAATAESQALLNVLEPLELMEKFVDLKLSPDDYKKIEALARKQFTFSWPVTLNEQLKAQGFSSRSYEGLDRLNASMPILQQFYRVTQSRDQVLAGNAIAKLNETHETLAILITGGFHGPEIAKQLSGAGVGVVVMVPRMLQATNDKLYEAVLKYKSGLGSWMEVEAASTVQGKAP